MEKMILTAVLLSTALLAEPAPGQSSEGATFHYDGEMGISPATGEIRLDWDITVSETGLDSVSFILNPHLGAPEISGEHVLSVETSAMEGVSGELAVYTIELAPGAGKPRQIAMRYAGVLLPEPMQHEINTVDPGKVELTVDSFWMPFDQRFSSLVTAEIDIAIAGEWAGVTMQDIEPVAGGFRLVQSRPALDVAFTLMSVYRRVDADGYSIFDLRPGSRTDLAGLIEALDFCTGYLNTLAGSAGPLPRAQVTVTTRESGGYSRGTLIALTDISDTEPEALTQFICHELGHFWSHGNAMSVENWLNESFADYIAVIGMRDAFGETAFNARLQGYRDQIADKDLPAIWTPSISDRPPYLVAYRKGPLALARLEERVGREAFARFLRATMVARVSTTPDMLEKLEATAGPDARTWFETVLAE